MIDHRNESRAVLAGFVAIIVFNIILWVVIIWAIISLVTWAVDK